MPSETRLLAFTGSYWFKLAGLYVLALAGALLLLFVTGVVSYRSPWPMMVGLMTPVVAAPVIFGVALTRSPWLRGAVVLRVLMIVTGTIALSALYVMMYAAYGMGIAVYARRTREFLQNAF